MAVAFTEKLITGPATMVQVQQAVDMICFGFEFQNTIRPVSEHFYQSLPKSGEMFQQQTVRELAGAVPFRRIRLVQQIFQIGKPGFHVAEKHQSLAVQIALQNAVRAIQGTSQAEMNDLQTTATIFRGAGA